MGKEEENKSFYTADNLPTHEQLGAELNYLKYRRLYFSTMRSIVYILIVVAAVAMLIATQVLPFFTIYGNSMLPNLQEGDMIAGIKTNNFKQGDVIAFYFSNKILVKRVIAIPGQEVDIDESGNVFVDGVQLDEPYLTAKARGQCDIVLPFTVPEGKLFVLGDERVESVDSRTTAIGCVSSELIAGKLFFRVWPLQRIGLLAVSG